MRADYNRYLRIHRRTWISYFSSEFLETFLVPYLTFVTGQAHMNCISMIYEQFSSAKTWSAVTAYISECPIQIQ
jgi:hypothetical protein